MKRYKKAWTMAEVVMAMVVLAILASLSIQVIKPVRMKAKPYAYASILNLNKAAKSVMYDNATDKLSDEIIDMPVADSNKTCVGLAEAFSLVGDYTCVTTVETHPASGEGNTGVPNFQTSNMITYSGLEKDFTVTYRGAAIDAQKCATAEVGMKDVMIDINGDEGDNEVGKDQFPLKLMQTGEVFPGTCANIAPGARPSECTSASFNNPSLIRHPLCGSNNTKFIDENYPFAYNLYVTREPTGAEIDAGTYRVGDFVTQIIEQDVSFAKADCLSRGNILTRTQCSAMGYEPLDKCLEPQTYCFVRQARPVTSPIFSLPY